MTLLVERNLFDYFYIGFVIVSSVNCLIIVFSFEYLRGGGI
jgi:hypothetical protein